MQAAGKMERRLFAPYFGDTQACLDLMKKTQGVASGSAVLHCIEKRPRWKPNNLDMFIHEKDRREWVSFVQQQGFCLSMDCYMSTYKCQVSGLLPR